MRNHLNVDVVLAQHAEEAARDTDHVLELLADQADDGHIGHDVDGAQRAEVCNGAPEVVVLDLVLVLAAAAQEGGLGVDGHGDVDLGRGDEVDGEVPAVEDAEDAHEEAVGARALVTVHVKHDNVVLDGDGRGAFGAQVAREQARGARAEERRVLDGRFGFQLVGLVREDDGAVVARVHDVLDADGDARANHLLHGEGVDDLGAVEGEFGGFGGRHGREECRRGHLARVRGEDAVDFFPDLQFGGLDADCDEGGAEVGVAASDGAEDASWHVSKVSRDDRDFVAAGFDLLAQRASEIRVEGFAYGSV